MAGCFMIILVRPEHPECGGPTWGVPDSKATPMACIETLEVFFRSFDA